MNWENIIDLSKVGNWFVATQRQLQRSNEEKKLDYQLIDTCER